MWKFYSMQWMFSMSTKYTLDIVRWLKQQYNPLCWHEDGWLDGWRKSHILRHSCASFPVSWIFLCWTTEPVQRATSCMCVNVSESLVVTLEGVQVGFQAQGCGVGEVGGAVEVQARQELHVSDSGRVELQQVFDPLGLVLSVLQRHTQSPPQKVFCSVHPVFFSSIISPNM